MTGSNDHSDFHAAQLAAKEALKKEVLTYVKIYLDDLQRRKSCRASVPDGCEAVSHLLQVLEAL